MEGESIWALEENKRLITMHETTYDSNKLQSNEEHAHPVKYCWNFPFLKFWTQYWHLNLIINLTSLFTSQVRKNLFIHLIVHFWPIYLLKTHLIKLLYQIHKTQDSRHNKSYRSVLEQSN